MRFHLLLRSLLGLKLLFQHFALKAGRQIMAYDNPQKRTKDCL